MVRDEAGLSSAPDEVIVSSTNLPPKANPGMDRLVVVHKTANLNGAGSSDPNLDPLTYSWTIVSAPPGSTAMLVNPGTVTPSLTPDLVGSYGVQLVVNDGFVNSLPATLTITAISASDEAQNKLRDATALIGTFPNDAFDARGHKNFFLNTISDAVLAIQQGDLATARGLLNDVIVRTDGCTLRGTADPKGAGHTNIPDFVTYCPDAEQSYHLLLEALNLIGG